MKESTIVFVFCLSIVVAFTILHFTMDLDKNYNIYCSILYLELLFEFSSCVIWPVYIISKKKVLRIYLWNEIEEHNLNWWMRMGDSHIAGKKYWIISRVVEVITSQSNEFITSGRRPRVINSLLDKWLPQPRVILSNTFCQLHGNNIP